MRRGLYKVDFHTVHGTGCGVVYATEGKLRGGNSAFAFMGTYLGSGDSIKVKISTERYNDDPAFKARSASTRSRSRSAAGKTATWRSSRAPRCSCPGSPSGRC